MAALDRNGDGKIDWDEFEAHFGHAHRSLTATAPLLAHVAALQKLIQERHGKNTRAAFEEMDANGSRRLSYQEFSAALKEKYAALGLDHEQRRALFKWIDENGSGNVSYREFKAAFDPRVAKRVREWQGAVMQRVCDVVRRARTQLRAAFRHLDVGNEQAVSEAAFAQALECMNELLERPLSALQLQLLSQVVPRHKDGRVAYAAFLSSFAVIRGASSDAAAQAASPAT
jgi:Ca2+-binding EF-hand superfamily protein